MDCDEQLGFSDHCDIDDNCDIDDLEEKIKSLFLPLCTDVALANILIYIRQSDKKPVVQHRNVYQNNWSGQEIIWKAHSFFCWHDACEHYGVPVVLPIAYDDRRERFAAIGKFCSFKCAIKFQFTRRGFFHTYIRMLTRLLAHKVYGFDIDTKFQPAPARESLELFGNCGPVSMTIEQFRTATHTSSFRKPPFFTPDRVHQDSGTENSEPVYSVILYQSWEAGYVVVSSFNNNLQSMGHFSGKSVCWHDTEPFDGNPIGIPIAINKQSKSNNSEDDEPEYSNDGDEKNYLLYGCFCSIECALAYLFEIRDWNNDVQLIHTHLMAKDYYGIEKIIEPAPPAWELTKFDGSLSIKEFRNYCTKNLKKSLSTKSEILWICTGIEYHSDTLPERGYTTLRKQGIAVTKQLYSPTSDKIEKLLERPLYLQYLERLEQRARENNTESQNSHTNEPTTITKTSSSSSGIIQSKPNSRNSASGGTSSMPKTTTTRSKSKKEPSHSLEVGSLMQYMRKTRPTQQHSKNN